jgi:hypothetical protein
MKKNKKISGRDEPVSKLELLMYFAINLLVTISLIVWYS